jgi:hypothetical protein
MSGVPRWTIADLIDLEAFLAVDSQRGEKDLAARDRRIFKIDIAPKLPPRMAGDHRAKLRLWLAARRRSANTPTPGEYFQQAWHSLITILVFAGLLIGSGVSASHLFYYGHQPINVLIFFSATVGIQTLFLTAGLLAFLGHGLLRSFHGFTFIRWVAESILWWLLSKKEALLNRLSGSKRSSLLAAWGTVQAKTALYKELTLWPAVIALQAFVIAFNVGVIATLLFQVTVSNRAFGWESTLHIADTSMYRIVEAASLPWSWFSSNAHPSLEQVAQSHIVLQGSATYSPDALASWWPFLSYSVLFYGLIPRALLLAFASLAQRRGLNTLQFDTPECHQLLRRMEPVIVAGPAGPPFALAKPELQTEETAVETQTNSGTCIALVSKDLDVPSLKLDELAQQHGWTLTARFDTEIDNANAGEELLAELSKADWTQPQATLAIFADESQPPVKAVLKFLSAVRSAVGVRTHIQLLLVSNGYSRKEAFPVWRQFIQRQGDPYLTVQRVEHHG